MPKFTGFPTGGVDFFRVLSVKQDREWFHQHRADYQQLWEAPMRAFLAEVQAGLARQFPEAKKTEPKVFRIYRDTRFSKDKSPFKTSISGLIPLYRGGMMERVGLYFELGPSPFVACGRWLMEPPVLKRFRRAVADERTGSPFVKAVATAVARGFAVESHEQLARVPKGWPKDHPRGELLRQKGFALTFPTPAFAEIESPRLVRWSLDHVKAIAPVMKWVERVARGQRASFD
ncbi:MAG: DUF2461 domain-containing protein [Myxococcaceae bacterium]|nr:DUF2461 domain-containing protein [Myxococcaceae bacterium]